MLAKSKLNSIEILVSQVLILKEKDKDEKKKDNLRSENEKFEIMRLSSIKSFYAIKKKIFLSCVCIK